MVWAYVDPVTILPVTSIIATVVGLIMLCGRSILHPVKRLTRLARLRRLGATGLRGTHFALTHRQDGDSDAAAAIRYGVEHGHVPEGPDDRSGRRMI